VRCAGDLTAAAARMDQVILEALVGH